MEAVIRFLGIDDTKAATDSAAKNTDEIRKSTEKSNKAQTESYESLTTSLRKFSRELKDVSRFAVEVSAATVGFFTVAFKNAAKDLPEVDSAIKDIGNSFQVLSNNVAQAALPTLKEFGQFISGLANAVTGFVQRNQEFVNSFLKWSAITLTIALVGVTIAKFIKAMLSLFQILSTGIGVIIGLVSKFGVWGLAIAGLTAIFILFKDQIIDFLKKIPIIGKAIEGLESGFKDITGGIDKIMKDFEEGTTAHLQRTQDAFGSFAKGLKSTFNSLNENATTFGNSIGQAFEKGFSDTIFNAITGKLHGIRDVLKSVGEDILRAFSKLAANEILGTIFGDREGTKTGIGGFLASIGKLFGFGKGASDNSPLEKLKQETGKVAEKFTGLAHNMDKFARSKDRLMENFDKFSRQIERGSSSSKFGSGSKFGGSQGGFPFPPGAGGPIPLPGADDAAKAVGGISPIPQNVIDSATQMSTALGLVTSGANAASAGVQGIGNSYLEAGTNFVISTAISLAASLGALAIAVSAGVAAAAALTAAWIPAAVAASIATFGGAAAAGGSAVAGSIGANQAFAASIANQGVSQAQINFTSLPKLATGGIVNKPTVALIGESGPEAVIPLNKQSGGLLGGSSDININVNIDKAILDSPSNVDEFVHKLSEQLFYLVDKGTKRSRTANA